MHIHHNIFLVRLFNHPTVLKGFLLLLFCLWHMHNIDHIIVDQWPGYSLFTARHWGTVKPLDMSDLEWTLMNGVMGYCLRSPMFDFAYVIAQDSQLQVVVLNGFLTLTRMQFCIRLEVSNYGPCHNFWIIFYCASTRWVTAYGRGLHTNLLPHSTR